jgi:hypothetical protein
MAMSAAEDVRIVQPTYGIHLKPFEELGPHAPLHLGLLASDRHDRIVPSEWRSALLPSTSNRRWESVRH